MCNFMGSLSVVSTFNRLWENRKSRPPKAKAQHNESNKQQLRRILDVGPCPPDPAPSSHQGQAPLPMQSRRSTKRISAVCMIHHPVLYVRGSTMCPFKSSFRVLRCRHILSWNVLFVVFGFSVPRLVWIFRQYQLEVPALSCVVTSSVLLGCCSSPDNTLDKYLRQYLRQYLR